MSDAATATRDESYATIETPHGDPTCSPHNKSSDLRSHPVFLESKRHYTDASMGDARG